MICDGCVYYHPYREKKCSIVPRSSEMAGATSCACRLEAPERALDMRTVTAEETRRMAQEKQKTTEGYP